MQKQILIFLASLLFFLNVSAQDKYRAVNWGLDDGLSQGGVFAMMKDIHGFLWIRTFFGLNRFDGSTFKKYFADKTQKNKTIIDNSIQSLIEDSLHNIWIGTGRGYSWYDIKADTFRNVSYSIPGNYIIPFWATKDEVFCLEPDNLTAYNIHSFAKRTLAGISPTDTVGYAESSQYGIFDSSSNSLWLERGYPGKGGGLLQISLTDGIKKEFDWPCYLNFPNHSHFSEGMRYDRKRKSIWISSSDGLMEFTLQDKKFHHIDALNELEKGKEFHIWAGIDIDRDGRVWMVTYPKGIIIYDPVNNSVERPFPNDSIRQNNVSDENVFLYCDKEGMVWSGFWSRKGIYQIIPYSPAVKHYVADPDKATHTVIFNCINAGQGKIWMGSANGIYIFNPNTSSFDLLSVRDLPGITGMGGGAAIGPLNIDTIGKKAWILGDGIYEMEMASRKCSRVMYEDSSGHRVDLQSMFARHPQYLNVIPYKNGCILTAAFTESQEILLVTSDDPLAKKIVSFPGEKGSLYPTFTDDDHLLFLRRPDAATNLTYAEKGKNWVLTATPFDSIPWSSIFYNKADQTYWIIVQTQLSQYDKNLQLIHAYTKDQGLPGVPINSLIPDDKGNIWFNTDRSIFQLDTKTGTITRLTEKDGFLPQDLGGFSAVKTDDGDLYMTGGSEGFEKISPDKFSSPSSSFVYLQSLKVNQKLFPLSTGINDLQELSLRYFENKITIESGIIDYYSRGKSRIRYKLEVKGKNADWQYAPDHFTIQYEELPPGNYRLVIQASNASNEFNSPEKILLIHISPPFWKTWWFMILATVSVLTLLFGFIRYRSRALRARNIQLEEKVLHRTKELKHSLEDLRETQAQLIQREKMASLGELTAGIAHEIQNPLNFVNNFSEVNKELLAEMTVEIQKGNFEEVNILVKDLTNNEEKISQHGKRADAIVKGMLQHSRSSTGVKEPVDINAIADECLRLSYHGLRAKDKSFQANLQTDFDNTIGLIPLIQQDIVRVLVNLFNNAFYALSAKSLATGDGNYKPTVSVSTKKINDKIVIKVSDNGTGIPPNVVEKIFQPFFTTKPTGQGTGLGLSMSYDVVKAHGGELKVETKEGEGTEFIIELQAK